MLHLFGTVVLVHSRFVILLVLSDLGFVCSAFGTCLVLVCSGLVYSWLGPTQSSEGLVQVRSCISNLSVNVKSTERKVDCKLCLFQVRSSVG